MEARSVKYLVIMNNRIKKIAIGVAATASIVVGAVISGNTQPLTIGEFNTLIQIYDHEIVAAGGDIDLKNIRNNAIQKFNEMILQRVVTERVMIDGQLLSPEAYTILRQEMVDKSNKNIK